MLVFRYAFQQASVYSELHATHCWSIGISVAAAILHSKFFIPGFPLSGLFAALWVLNHFWILYWLLKHCDTFLIYIILLSLFPCDCCCLSVRVLVLKLKDFICSIYSYCNKLKFYDEGKCLIFLHPDGFRCIILMSPCFVQVDVIHIKKPFILFQWMGMNALIVYILAACELFPTLIQGFYWRSPENNLVNVLCVAKFMICCHTHQFNTHVQV